MEPSLSWIDLTSRDRDVMRRALDLLSEQGTVDELGLGTIRDILADALFPGTSTIQTRLRYFLFVPWIYQKLERRRVSSEAIVAQARKEELALIDPLLSDQNEDREGVIGARARSSLSRLPSAVYWAGLVRLGIFLPAQSQGWYHLHFDAVGRNMDDLHTADDPGVVWSKEHTWHPRLPKAPKDFPSKVSLELTFNEADFLRGRLEERVPDTLLTWMATKESPGTLPRSFWDDPDLSKAPAAIRETVEVARRFSLHFEGAPLLYNLLLAERRLERHGSEEDADWRDRYQVELERWADQESVEPPFDTNVLWTQVHRNFGRVASMQREFVNYWSDRLTKIGAHAVAGDQALRQRIETREYQLKGSRARLKNDGRLLDWSGSVGVGRMDFRWNRVRQLLQDLYLGLGLHALA